MDSLEPTEGNRDELILKQQRDIEKEVICNTGYFIVNQL